MLNRQLSHIIRLIIYNKIISFTYILQKLAVYINFWIYLLFYQIHYTITLIHRYATANTLTIQDLEKVKYLFRQLGCHDSDNTNTTGVAVEIRMYFVFLNLMS